MKARLTQAFFDEPLNEPFFMDVDLGRVYDVEMEPNPSNYQFRLMVNGEWMTSSAFGFACWHNFIPVRREELEFIEMP